MFDDVLKGAKKAKASEELKSKNNKVEEVPPPIVDIEKTKETKPSTHQKRKSSGKRTDPAYKQVGAYIKKDTHLQIQRLLLEQPHKDFSDLVQELLSDYLVKQSTN